jgi:hypothetical protein
MGLDGNLGAYYGQQIVAFGPFCQLAESPYEAYSDFLDRLSWQLCEKRQLATYSFVG